MTWLKTLTAYLVTAQFILAPRVAFAQTQNNNEALAKYAQGLGYDSHLDKANNRMVLIDRNTKKVAMEVPLNNEKTLSAYSPKNLNQKLTSELSKVKMANRAAWSHAVRSFPLESTTFNILMGALTALQLNMDYGNNPVGWVHQINQMAPVGQFGFFLFMYSQGVTANTLEIMLKRPKLAMPIGMLGMTVGMTVQTYFSQVAMDPHIRACVASLVRGEKPEGNDHPCEGAYKYLVLDKKILEGPGIASMLGTFLITVGGKMALGAVLKMVGFEIGLLVAPGGLGMKFARVAINGANIALFTVIQMKLEHAVAYAWNNYFDGNEFVDINDTLVSDIETQKQAQWTLKPEKMDKDLRHFSKKMAEWRANNLSDAYMANQAWTEFLNELTSMYNASYNFYSNYMSQLTTPNSMIDRPYPLFGVKPKGLAAGHESLYVLRPEFIERMQAETTVDVAKEINEKIENDYFKKLGVNKEQSDALTRLQKGLSDPDLQVKGKALAELSELILKYRKTIAGYPGFHRDLYEIYQKLGAPRPLFEKGRGFAESMLLSPETMAPYKDLHLKESNFRFYTPNAADYFLVQMMCGPDKSKKDEIITVKKGFPAKFHAPAVVLNNNDREDLCSGLGAVLWPRSAIYDLPASSYRTIPEFLRANMDPEATTNFVSWWEKGTEAELRKAFKGFAKSYEGVKKKLYAGLNNNKMSLWNKGFISNGALTASFQELRLYSLVLGEILKDTYKSQNQAVLPQEYFASTPDGKVTLSASDYTKSKKPLLANLGRGSNYDFAALTSAQANADTRSLKIQKELEGEFSRLNALVQSAQKSSLKSQDLQDQLRVIESKLSEFSSLLGINQDNPTPGLVNLSADQRTLAVTCLELLQAVSQEMAMYANMALTATYPEANE